MKNILIVSPYFAPENSVASIRFTKLAKYMVLEGYNVDVLCTQMTNYFIVDKSLEKDLSTIKNVYRVNYPKLLYYSLKKKFGVEKNPSQVKKDTSKIEKKIKYSGTREQIIGMLVQLHLYMCDCILAFKYQKFVKKKKQKYDVVITTFNPFAPHKLGRYMKKHGLCKVWIADFRDSLMSLQEKNFITYWLEKQGAKVVKDADYISAVSDGGLNMLEKEMHKYGINIERKKIRISNGYDPMDRQLLKNINVLHEDKLVITYCGTVYNFAGKIQTDVSPLFQAVQNLIQKGLIRREFVEIHYAGATEQLFLGLAAKYHVDDIVVYHGILSRDESLKLQRQSDIITVAIWNNKESNGILTGKFFETILVQRNVLCLVKGNQGNSELGTIIKENNYGFVYEEINGDKKELLALENWLKNRYEEKIKNGFLTYHATEEQVNKFSHKNIEQTLSMYFEG